MRNEPAACGAANHMRAMRLPRPPSHHPFPSGHAPGPPPPPPRAPAPPRRFGQSAGRCSRRGAQRRRGRCLRGLAGARVDALRRGQHTRALRAGGSGAQPCGWSARAGAPSWPMHEESSRTRPLYIRRCLCAGKAPFVVAPIRAFRAATLVAGVTDTTCSEPESVRTRTENASMRSGTVWLLYRLLTAFFHRCGTLTIS
jgi:hypothetical protein